jgi:sigma-E factor negative regulatory protein RseB
MKRRALWCVCAGALAVAGLSGAFERAGADASSADAVRMVERMRDAPSTLRFSATVRVTWRDRGATNDMVVHVTDDMGVLEVDSGAARVFDRGTHTYFKSDLGWSSALAEPDRGASPAPDHRWRLVVARGRTIAGRPTELVEAERADGTPAQRLFLDSETGMVLRREVLDPRGRVQRSLEFVTLDMGTASAPQAPRGVAARQATPLESVPSGYEAPRALAGYVLVAQSRHPNGVEFVYSDGMFSASLLEQRGDLDWDGLPARGTTADIEGTRTRRYSDASADVVMFEHDGTVFTLVTDAPPDSVAALVDRLTPDRSTAEQVVDFVLGPFGWN